MILSALIALFVTSALGREISKKSTTTERFSSLTHDMESELRELETEMRSLLERFSSKLHSFRETAFAPRIEIKEGPKEYDIKAEVPGIVMDDIKVVVKKNDVLISGTRESEIKKSSETSTSTEFHYGNFERLIHLDKKVDSKSMKTEYKDGIISIHLHKML